MLSLWVFESSLKNIVEITFTALILTELIMVDTAGFDNF